ncbi:MAG: class I SAM-dependent methyltransferase [Deltaproteobacteria bacterium]|jgi:SAM-dependent methyltransferase|nr:class I SAM-dependent methyltransferase [Deltaproteobacteria bacterium]MBW2530158.1 class I SAM-dependent methyltransferase [Deltaproteobacteria bacterium]
MKDDLDVFAYNRRAWDRQVRDGDRWTIPVEPEVIAAARRGDWSVVLTPSRPVPRDWFPEDFEGVRVLALACGGGQQGPVFAAAGAEVTVLDAAASQLAQDRAVATREGLSLRTVQGDMGDLSAFGDGSFDLVFHPVANLFVPEIRGVWKEASRVLRRGGELLAGFANPLYFLFDDEAFSRGELVVRYRIPYADTEQLDASRLEALMADEQPLCFGHTLEDQIAGQLDAGLALVGFYEDRWDDKIIDDRIATFIATRACKA